MAERISPSKNREIVLLIGSNIHPVENIRQGISELSKLLPVLGKSSLWETAAFGTSGSNFLNIAVSISTNLDTYEIKYTIIRNIETSLGRIRTEDKFAPRTIDIDIIVDGTNVVEPNLWILAYIAVPVAELTPKLVHPAFGKSLFEVAIELKQNSWIQKYPAGENE